MRRNGKRLSYDSDSRSDGSCPPPPPRTGMLVCPRRLRKVLTPAQHHIHGYGDRRPRVQTIRAVCGTFAVVSALLLPPRGPMAAFTQPQLPPPLPPEAAVQTETRLRQRIPSGCLVGVGQCCSSLSALAADDTRVMPTQPRRPTVAACFSWVRTLHSGGRRAARLNAGRLLVHVASPSLQRYRRFHSLPPLLPISPIALRRQVRRPINGACSVA